MDIKKKSSNSLEIASKSGKITVSIAGNGTMSAILSADKQSVIDRPGEYGYATFNFTGLELEGETYDSSIDIFNIVTPLNTSIIVCGGNLDIKKTDLQRMVDPNVFICPLVYNKELISHIKSLQPEYAVFIKGMAGIEVDEKDLAKIKGELNFAETSDDKLKVDEPVTGSEEEVMTTAYIL